MILRNIVLVSAALFSCNLLAQSGPRVGTVTPNATANAAKLIKPLPPAEPEIMLSIFVFDPTNNPNSGVDVTQNGKMWGNCKWSGVNAQPVAGQPSTKLCKFSAPRGTKVALTPLPGSPAVAAWQCNSSGSGMCYKAPAFELARDGQVEAAFNIKP
jgi:hypothetical protein